MNWYSIGLAAVSGGLAALIASLIFARKSKKSALYVAAVVLLFAVFNGLSKHYLLPSLTAPKKQADIDSALAQVPAFASIKRYEPETYENLLASLMQAKKEGYSELQIIALVRSHISALVDARIPHASDQAVLAYVGVTVDEMKELKAQGNGLCYQFLFPQGTEVIDSRKVFSQETQQRDLLALDKIIQTSNQMRELPTEAEVLPYLQPVLVNLHEKFGEDVLMLDNPTAEDIDKARVCEISIELYQGILQLESLPAASTLRWMFS